MEMAVKTTHPLRQSRAARNYPFGYRFTKRIAVGCPFPMHLLPQRGWEDGTGGDGLRISALLGLAGQLRKDLSFALYISAPMTIPEPAMCFCLRNAGWEAAAARFSIMSSR